MSKKNSPNKASKKQDALTYNLLDVDVNKLPADSSRLASIKNLVLAASLLATAPAALAATNNREVSSPKNATAAALVNNSRAEAEALAHSVTADPSQKGTLNVKTVAGVPVVDINAPNAAGVSDNRFTSFSTNTGVVFKNNTIEINSRVLKQKIARNPNLREAARVILAQVTGHDKSVIKGTLEVLGKKADLLVINPNGIDLNGVAVVNARDFTAATAEVSADNYRTMTVKRGEINVNSDFTTDDINMLKLIAQAVKVKAKIAPSAGYKGKKADILVSGGKQKYDVATNKAKALEGAEASTQVAISGSELGSMYGSQINFIVSETGAGVDFGNDLLADDNIEITADGDVQIGTTAARNSVKVTSKAANVKVRAGQANKKTQVVGKKVALKAAKAVESAEHTRLGASEEFTAQGQSVKVGDQLVSAGSATLDADTVDLTSADVQAKTFTVKADARKVKTSAATKVAAEEVKADLSKAEKSSAADLSAADDFLAKTKANRKTIATTNVEVAADESFAAKAANKVEAAQNIINQGQINFLRRNITTSEGETTVEQAVLSAGKEFDNFGLLVADGLEVNAQNLKLDGNTVLFADSLINADTVSQKGNLAVEGDLKVITKSYVVEGQVEGQLEMVAAKGTESSHYADHALRRDLYQITTSVGKVDFSNILVKGGEVKVTGNLTVEGKEERAEDGTVTHATENLFKATNANLYVGNNMSVNGDVYNAVSTFQVKVLDLLKQKAEVVFKFQPRTWINTALMRVKEQRFNSLYDLFQGLFGKGDFSWRNGGYRIQGEYVLDTFREALTDSYSQQLFATVFGADWRYADFATMAKRWEDFVAKDNTASAQAITFYAPGGQLTVGGSFTQEGGNFYAGSEHELRQEDLTTYQNQHFSFTAVRGGVENTKISRLFSLEDTVSKLKANGVLSTTDAGLVASSTANLSGLDNLRDFAAEVAGEEVANNLVGDDQALALLILEQVKAKAGNYFFQNKTEAQVVNNLIREVKTFNRKKAELNQWLETKLSLASDVGAKIYREQYAERMAKLKASYDNISFVKGADGKVAPVVEFSARTEGRLAKFIKQAAVVNAKDNLSVTSASKVETANALLATNTLTLGAEKVKLSGHHGQDAVDATTTKVQAGDFTLEGSASLGDLDLEAKTATFASKDALNEKGYLLQEGTVKANSAHVKADNLVFDGARFEAEQDALFEAKAAQLKAKREIISTYETSAVEGAVGTKATAKVVERVAGPSLSANNLTLEVTEGDLAMQSASLNAKENLKVNVQGNLNNEALQDFTATHAHEEKIDLSGRAGVSFAGYGASVDAALVTNEGKPKAKPKLQTSGAVGNGPSLGLTFSYETTDSKTAETKSANSAINAKAATINVAETAKIANLDLNPNFDGKGDVPAVEVSAKHIDASNVNKDKKEVEEHSSKFSLNLAVTAGSKALDAISTGVQAATAKIRNEGVDPTTVLSVISDLENLVIKPVANVGTQLEVAGEWNNSHETVESDSRNTYKGDVALKAKGQVDLKAIDGKDLNNFTVKGETITITSGESTSEVSANNQRIGLSANVDAVFDKGGPRVAVDGVAKGKFNWTKGNAHRHQNSEIDAKNLNLEATDVHLKGVSATADNVKVKTTVLDVQSVKDTNNQKTTGFGLDFSGGAAFGPAGSVSGHGAVGASFNHHVVKEDSVAKTTKVKANNNFNLKAEEATLKGATLEAAGASKFDIEAIKAEALHDSRVSDGGHVSALTTFSEKGFGRFTLSGGRDDRTKYEADVNASILGGKVLAQVDGELNKDGDKVRVETANETVSSTQFSFTGSKETFAEIKDSATKVFNKGKEIFNKITHRGESSSTSGSTGSKPATVDATATHSNNADNNGSADKHNSGAEASAEDNNSSSSSSENNSENANTENTNTENTNTTTESSTTEASAPAAEAPAAEQPAADKPAHKPSSNKPRRRKPKNQ